MYQSLVFPNSWGTIQVIVKDRVVSVVTKASLEKCIGFTGKENREKERKFYLYILMCGLFS